MSKNHEDERHALRQLRHEAGRKNADDVVRFILDAVFDSMRQYAHRNAVTPTDLVHLLVAESRKRKREMPFGTVDSGEPPKPASAGLNV